jgi:hypothetical protein
MQLRNKRLAVGVLSLSLVLGGATAALAVTEYPAQGGTWEYDASGTALYSRYLHTVSVHGSSVKTCEGAITRSPATRAGVWSDARRGDGCAFGVDYAYYRVGS